MMFNKFKRRNISIVIKVLLLCGVVFAILSITQYIVVQETNNIKPIFNEQFELEYGQNSSGSPYGLKRIEVSDFLMNWESFETVKLGKLDENGEFRDVEINIDSVGYFEISLEIASKNKLKVYTFKVKTIDSNYPKLEYPKEKSISVGETLNLNEEIKAFDIVDGDLKYTIQGNKYFDESGVYTVQISASDANGNTSFGLINVEVKAINIDTKQPVNKPVINNNSDGTINNQTKDDINDSSLNNIIKDDKKQDDVEIDNHESKNTVDVIESREDPYKIANELEMIFYKDFKSSDLCIETIYTLASQHWEDWDSSYCDDNGYLFYKKK